MQYRKDKKGTPISVLGYGCMRFPRKNGLIDMEKTEELIRRAVEAGINYYDTAYIYPGSENALGTVLAKLGLRDRVMIADKLPQYLMKSMKAVESCFKEQLSRLKTDRIDYYLMHMLTDAGSWEKLCEMGIRDWIDDKKAKGEIKNIGFSFHGNTETFLKILNAYDWDFCQIQYNYMDEFSQAGRAGLEAAEAKGIPVIIMEPLRGGKLVSMLPKGARDLIEHHKSGRSAADWALSWLWDQTGVTCVLSGMSTMEVLEEDLKIAERAVPGLFTEEDHAFLTALKEEINRRTKVGCTGCGYCQPCPAGVDIPLAFRCYNELYLESKAAGRKEYMQVSAGRKKPVYAGLCVGCGKCEQHCPQGIPIRQELKKAAKELETPLYKLTVWAVRLWKPWK